MAITSYPFDNQETTESQYSDLFRELQDSGVVDTFGGTSWRVTADASGMNVKAQPGFAFVRGFVVRSTAVETLTIQPAGSQPRTDRVVLRLDPAANTITPAVVKGDPGSTAKTPVQTDTGIFELSLALVTVGVGVLNINAQAVADDRSYVGSRVGVWSSATRPANPRRSRLGLNTTSGVFEYHDGSQWRTLNPTINWTTIEGKPSTFPASPHRHPWSEIDGAPSAFMPAAHSHPWSAITDKPNVFPAAAHTHSSTEVTAANGASVQAWIQHLDESKAHVSHGHDRVNLANWADRSAWADNSGYANSSGASNRSNGSDRPRGFTPAGSATWYSVWVDGNNNFCRNTSSRRFKKNIRDIAIDPNAVLALRPRIYDRRIVDGQEGRVDEFGLIAEEVAETLPEIVTYDDRGRVDALRYDLLGVALLPVVQRLSLELAELRAKVDSQ